MEQLVWAEPYERDGVAVLRASAVVGGGGGGRDGGREDGSRGLGLGLAARPVGAFVVRDGQVSWVPVLDRGRLALAAVAVVALLARWRRG